MSVDERARHRFFNKAVEVFGEEEAVTLMAHLPPGGWPNLATKQDLLAMKQDLLELEGRLKAHTLALEGRLKAHTLRTILAANLSMVTVFAGIVGAVLGLS